MDNDKTISVLFTFSSGQDNAKVEKRLDLMPAEPMFTAYIANSESYRNGGFEGIWHHFPTTTEDFEETLATLGISGDDDSGYFVEEYQSPIPNLRDALIKLPTCVTFEQLNSIAVSLTGFTDAQIEQFGAALLADRHKYTIRGAASIAENIDIIDKIRKVWIRGQRA